MTYQLKGASGTITGQRFPLAGRMLIGSSEDCDISLADSAVAPQHATLTIEPGSILIESLNAEAAIYVNGLETRSMKLGQGDEVRLGTTRLMVQAPGLKPERVLTPDAVSKAKGSRSRWLLAGLLLAAAAAGLAYYQGWIVI